MKSTLAAIFILSCSLSLAGQHLRAKSKPAMSAPTAQFRRDLNTSLADLQRVTEATNADISNLGADGGSGWKVWQKLSSHKRDERQMAASIQRNLTNAMPVLIRDVQNSHGSVYTTFKLYNNLNVVYETLDSLVETRQRESKKSDYGPLGNDLAAMGRVRQELSAYIQQASAAIESRRPQPYSTSYAASPSSSGQMPKKILIDDTAPQSHPAKKATTAASAPPPPKKIIIDDDFDSRR